MYPQPRRLGQTVETMIIVVFVGNYVLANPEKAAATVNHVVESLTRFMSALG